MTKQRIRAIATDSLELPAEIAFQTAKLVLVGNHTLKAINHRGILLYETEQIRFRTESGLVEIRGSELTLSELNEEYLRIEGHICSLQLIEAGEAAQ